MSPSLDQVAELMAELDGKQDELDANVMDQANAAVEGKINSAEVANILEDKLIVVFEGVLERLKEIATERKTARAEDHAAESINTKPYEEELSEAMRISRNIANYMNQRAELPSPDQEHRTRVLLEDVQQFLR